MCESANKHLRLWAITQTMIMLPFTESGLCQHVHPGTSIRGIAHGFQRRRRCMIAKHEQLGRL
jgi:hypothetical protein